MLDYINVILEKLVRNSVHSLVQADVLLASLHVTITVAINQQPVGCLISGFSLDVDEICSLLGYYRLISVICY